MQWDSAFPNEGFSDAPADHRLLPQGPSTDTAHR